MEFVNGFRMTSHIWNIIHSMVWNHQPVMFFNPLYSRSIYIPYIYIFHGIYIYSIYIPYIFQWCIPYIYSIYIPCIYIDSIYIPYDSGYIVRRYSIYIPYIESVVENCGTPESAKRPGPEVDCPVGLSRPTRTLILPIEQFPADPGWDFQILVQSTNGSWQGWWAPN